MKTQTLFWSLLCALLVLSACGDEADDDGNEPANNDPATIAAEINFKAVVNGEAFACGQAYTGVGTTDSELTLDDFRLYVHDVRLVQADGSEVPVELDQDNPFQHEGLALLDFEDKSATCANGTTEINTKIVGEVPAGEYTGVKFVLGVPFELNHADAGVAPSPLNLTTMFWNWNGGYKFMRVDGNSTGQAGLKLHLGSTACDGDMTGNVTTCANPNRAEITIDNFDFTSNTIVADLGAVLADSDIDANAMETPALCMSSPMDTDCPPIFNNLGISGSQTFFSVE